MRMTAHPGTQSRKRRLLEGAEWGSFRSILARPVLEPQLEPSDEAVHTIHVEKHISPDGESIEGPQVMFVHMVTRVLPGPFTNRRFQMVCFVMGHSVVSVGHISIACKINDLWLIAADEPAYSMLEKACCCPTDLCRVTAG